MPDFHKRWLKREHIGFVKGYMKIIFSILVYHVESDGSVETLTKPCWHAFPMDHELLTRPSPALVDIESKL